MGVDSRAVHIKLNLEASIQGLPTCLPGRAGPLSPHISVEFTSIEKVLDEG